MTTARKRDVPDMVGAQPWSVLARHENSFSSVDIIEYQLDDKMRVKVEPSETMIEMVLHNHPIQRFVEVAGVPGRHLLGNTAFFLRDNGIVLEWEKPMTARAVRCYFNREPKDRTFTQDELVAGMTLSSPVLARHLNRMVAELRDPGFESCVLLESLGRQIAVELGRFFRSRTATETLKLSQAQMAVIDQCIERDGPSLTTEMLADACHFSKRHFFRLFRRTTNLSPAEYVMLYRIERAKRLLREDKLIIKQIAYNCGFSNAAIFSAAFRRVTDFSPRDFQRTQRLE